AAYNAGNIQHANGRMTQAIAYYRQAIQLDPNLVEAHANLAAALNQTGEPDQAIGHCQKALTHSPHSVEAFVNLGAALVQLGNPTAAIAYFRKAIALDAESPEAYNNLGLALSDLGRLDEAQTCYQETLKIDPGYSESHNNLGILFHKSGCWQQSKIHFQNAIQLNPDNPLAYHNLANIHKELGELNEAIALYEKALSLKDNSLDTCLNLALAKEQDGDLEAATSYFQQALAINPEHPNTNSHLVHFWQRLCDWQKLDTCSHKLDRLTSQALADNLKPAEMPFLALTRNMDQKRHFDITRAWSAEISQGAASAGGSETFAHFSDGQGRQPDHKITIGYLSNNFKNHPTAHLISGMFRHHNRIDFDIFCYSYGEDDGSVYRQRIQQDCDRFVDIQGLSHRESAKKINQDRVDILVDLVGYLSGQRMAIAALRPAPVQVRWLGHAGTSGADFFDYLITDRIVTPLTSQAFYSEKFVYLPHSYQINDDRQKISEPAGRRPDWGLPPDGFVFSCFCSPYKLDAVMFDLWMRILRQVPASVLWLLKSSAIAERNLHRHASACGIEPGRLIFAPKIGKADHLNRLQLADLALDTRIVNGAATTSDALWAGLPVLTHQGKHFASRMSASILSSIGLQELVTRSLESYEKLAVKLASCPNQLSAIRRRLKQRRLTTPLFNTAGFVINLELGFKEIWAIRCAQDRPRTIWIRDVNAN
ncbi:MAG: tetratricopeptide repeat protein, partial [Desulfobacterales bacterium]|nr:tetratricopeptide repeat protein [Desulfobacterales bacterium]